MQPIISALWITLIGMGLVFIAILLLWGMMALLVKLTPDKAEAESANQPELPAAQPSIPEADGLTQRKRRAAVAAVIAARILQSTPPASGMQAQPAPSPWQSSQRAASLTLAASATRKANRK